MAFFARYFGGRPGGGDQSSEDEEDESTVVAAATAAAELERTKQIESLSSSSNTLNGDCASSAGGCSLDGQSSSLSLQHEQEDKSAQENPLLPEELCELPTFLNTACCDLRLVEETRKILKKKYLKRPESFVQEDYERMLRDDWTVSRFLLRCRLQPKRAARLMEQCGKFRREYRMGASKLSDFPIEFHRAGGLFRYAPDRVGNQTLFMRVKMHRRVPELSQIMKEFILCCLEECDRANNGRGTAVIFDLTNCGLQNVDLGFLFWLVYSFRNYCPKGLSYIIIYNLPWILNATAKLALSWLSSTNRRRLRFVSGDGITDFIAAENLPDYMGGTCEIDYRHVPEGSRLAEETAEAYKLTRAQSRKIREIYAKFLKEVDSDITIDDCDQKQRQQQQQDADEKRQQHEQSSNKNTKQQQQQQTQGKRPKPKANKKQRQPKRDASDSDLKTTAEQAAGIISSSIVAS